MGKMRSLAKSISRTGWGEFREFLTYKAERYGRTLAVVDRWYPSSKTCSVCGHLLASLSLGTRHWSCPDCGTRHDRDLNAAKNIKTAGGLPMDACGGDVRQQGSTLLQPPAKQEPSTVKSRIPVLQAGSSQVFSESCRRPSAGRLATHPGRASRVVLLGGRCVHRPRPLGHHDATIGARDVDGPGVRQPIAGHDRGISGRARPRTHGSYVPSRTANRVDRARGPALAGDRPRTQRRRGRWRTPAASVAVATLAGADTEKEAAQLLGLLPDLSDPSSIGRCHALARWTRNLYPGQRWWNPLEPDLLGEHLVATHLTEFPQVLSGVLKRDNPVALTQPLDLYARAAAAHPTLAAALRPVLSADLEALCRAAIRQAATYTSLDLLLGTNAAAGLDRLLTVVHVDPATVNGRITWLTLIATRSGCTGC
jgi:predicted RNA-binding Zn-ribbon protein involved in translation (DUF1610 family)